MKSVTRWEPRPWEGRVISCCVQVVDMVVFGAFVEGEMGIALGWETIRVLLSTGARRIS